MAVRLRRGAKAGFTLLEVVVSLVLLAAGLMGLIAMFSGSLRLSEGARDYSTAAVYASQRMEEALLAPGPAPGVESGDFDRKYRWTTRTSFLDPDEGSPFQPVRIEVVIQWETAGRERSVAMSAVRWERRDAGAGG